MSVELELEGGGKLRMWEDAGRVFFRCERTLSSEGIYKVWIGGDRGEMLLGTLIPEGERLVLGRAVWQMELRRCGCWPVRWGCCRLAVPFGNRQSDGWHWEEHPEQYVDCETAQLGEWRRMLVKKQGDALYLAWPVRETETVPLTALICLAQPTCIRGEMRLVWRFDGNGKPCLSAAPQETEKSRAR